MRLQSTSMGTSVYPAVLLLIAPTLAEGTLLSRASALPSCATQCLVQAAASSACAITNQTCICTNQPLQDAATVCVLRECTVKEALFTRNATATTCHAPLRDKTQLLSNITLILGVITGFLVVLRVGFKLLILKMPFTMDDWMILLTTAVGVPSTVIGVRGVARNGLGRDVWTLPYDTITEFGRFFYAMVVLYFAQITLLKMSLLYFYLRIFPAKKIRNLLWATMAFNVAFGTACVFGSIFQCTPISYLWEKWDGEHEGSCIDINALGWANAAISIALDVWMLAIPLSQLPGLNLHWKKKMGVAIMFIVGTFVTVVSILRLQSLVTFANSTNPTWDNWEVSFWSTIEMNVGIMCACLPTARLVLVRLFPVFGGSAGRTAQYYGRPDNRNSWHGANHSRAVADPRPVGDSRVGRKGTITYQKSFAVRYSDQDEESLVHMRDLESRDAQHGRSDERSETSI